MVLGSICVINQTSRQYPMVNLKREYFTCRGYFCGLVHEAVDEGVTEIMVFSWVDCNRSYFIATRGSLEEVQDVSKHRWIQSIADVNEDAHML